MTPELCTDSHSDTILTNELPPFDLFCTSSKIDLNEDMTPAAAALFKFAALASRPNDMVTLFAYLSNLIRSVDDQWDATFSGCFIIFGSNSEPYSHQSGPARLLPWVHSPCSCYYEHYILRITPERFAAHPYAFQYLSNCPGHSLFNILMISRRLW